MLIAVSIKNPEISAELSEAFGESKYFLIYNSSDNSEEYLQNPFSTELGGAGIQSARFLIEKYIEAVIVTNIGLNSLRLFNSLKIKVYQCNFLRAEESIKLFTANKLREIIPDEQRPDSVRKRKRYRRRSPDYLINNNKKK